MVGRSTLGLAAPLSVSAFASIVLIHSASAATHEQIVERCRESARPQVHACMMGKRGTGDRESNLAACRASIGRPMVTACVLREEQLLAKGKPPPAAPKIDTTIGLKGADSVPQVFVPPPRTIADITAILDSEKPDPAKIAERKARADAAPPATTSPVKLAQFYYDRGTARAWLARSREALADGQQAITVGKGMLDYVLISDIQQLIGLQYQALGDPKQAISTFQATMRLAGPTLRRGITIDAMDQIATVLVSMGDVSQASSYAGRVETLVQEARGSLHPNWRKAYPLWGNLWESNVNSVRALIFEARGQYAEAEAAYRRSEAFCRAALSDLGKWPYPRPREVFLLNADSHRLSIARNEAKQGRLSEAEADARRALLEILSQEGKYNPVTPPFIIGLAGILVEQGRYQESERLARAALDVQRTLGIGDGTAQSASILSELGNILVLQHKNEDATDVYAQLDKAVAQWTPERRQAFVNDSRIVSLYASGQIEAGVNAAEAFVKRQIARTGEKSFDTAAARGTLAVGYARAGRDADAIREFKTAMPIMMAAAHENSEEDDPTVVAARNVRLQRSVEFYIGVLARTNATNDVAIETFALADAVRGHAVQQALADSSARAVAKDPALAALVRTEQDRAKEINAQLGALNNLLALPTGERDEQRVHAHPRHQPA